MGYGYSRRPAAGPSPPARVRSLAARPRPHAWHACRMTESGAAADCGRPSSWMAKGHFARRVAMRRVSSRSPPLGSHRVRSLLSRTAALHCASTATLPTCSPHNFFTQRRRPRGRQTDQAWNHILHKLLSFNHSNCSPHTRSGQSFAYTYGRGLGSSRPTSESFSAIAVAKFPSGVWCPM